MSMVEWRNGFVNAISSHKLERAVEIRSLSSAGINEKMM